MTAIKRDAQRRSFMRSRLRGRAFDSGRTWPALMSVAASSAALGAKASEERFALKKSDKKIDKVVDMTFPANDPTPPSKPTGTEKALRPVDLRAPAITKEQIDGASRGDDHRENS